MYPDAGEVPAAGVITGGGTGQRAFVHGDRQRRHSESRCILPCHGEEGPAGAEIAARCNLPLRVPGGLGRRLPADAG